MHSLDHLIDTLPLPGDEPDGMQPHAEPTHPWALGALAAAEDPVLSLNQLSLALEAQAQGDAQWATALPSPWREQQASIEANLAQWREAVRREGARQAHDYAELLDLGSQPPRYPRQLIDTRQQAQLQRLFERLGHSAPDSLRLAPWRSLFAARHDAWKRAKAVVLGDVAGWGDAATLLGAATLDAMRAESALQGLEQDSPVGELLSAGRPLTWLAVEVQQVRLPGIWVAVDAHAWASARGQVPMVLWLHGEGGGLAHLDDHPALLARLAFTLQEGGLPVARAMPEGDSELRLVSVEGGLPVLVAAAVNHWLDSLAQTPAEDRERQLELARAALAIPADTCRQVALSLAERQWQADALIEHIPAWVWARSDDERAAYAETLQDYHASASALEIHLQEQLPAFPDWAGQLLKARIFDDLGIEVRIDEILLWRPDPSMDLSQPYIPSTVAEIACENFDPDSDEEYRRLDLARWHVPGIDHDYLARVLPELDPLKAYEQKLRAVFDPVDAQARQRLRLPFVLELKLLATTERWRSSLSERAAGLLERAAEAASRAELETAGLRLHWLLIHARQELGHTVEGATALVDEQGHALIYLPGAPANVRLIERDSLEEAVAYLESCIASTPQLALYLVQRCAGDPSALLSYLQQAALRGYSGYLRTAPSLDQTLVGVQLSGRCNLLLTQARDEGRSQRSIRADTVQAAHVRHVGYLWLALGVVPGLGAWQSITAIHDGALEVAESWRTGDSLQMIRGTLSVAMGIVDILLTAIPVGASLSALRRVVRQVVSQRAARLPFRGYASNQLLDGAEPLSGIDANTWRQQGRQYLWQDGQAYEVYRRTGESTLRLRATATRLYEAPVRREGGRWVMHADVGLRGGGGKLNECERLFADWGPRGEHPPFRGTNRMQALRIGRRELQRYAFRDERQQLEFAHALLQDGAAPSWASQYLRTGALVPPPVAADGWQAVRWNLGEGDRIVTGRGGRVWVTFDGSEQMRLPGVRLDGHYYPILPGGDMDAIVHLRPAAIQPTTLAELDDLIARGVGPMRVEVGSTPVDSPRFIGGYTQTFGQRLATRFPRLSESSRLALGERLYQQADTQSRMLTHTRLMTLERRLADPQLEPLRELVPVSLNRPLRELTVQPRSNGFQQLCWPLQPGENQAMREALASLEPHALSTLFGELLTARGYRLMQSFGPMRGQLLIFRRAGFPEIYLLLQERSMGALSLQGVNGLVLLSEPWLDMVIANISDMRFAAVLRVARRQGMLRPMLGGVHLDGPNNSVLVWERVSITANPNAPLPLIRNWRHELRTPGPDDVELVAGTGLYGTYGQASVVGASVNGRLLPVYPVERTSRVLLSRSSSLPGALSFDDLEQCVRLRFSEQPWLVIRGNEGWSVRRPLFSAPLDRRVSRGRPALTRQSSLNAARHVFERAEGSDHQRLLQLENVISGWTYGTRPVDELADPLLLLREQLPSGLDSATAWRLPVPVDSVTATPALFYLRPTQAGSQGLLAAVSGTRMRHLAPNLVDSVLVEYGLSHRYRSGNVALYYQPSSQRVYIVALASSEQAGVELAFHEGRALLSDDWLAHWRQQLPTDLEQILQLSQSRGRLERLVAVLCLQDGPHVGQVAVIRLAPF